MIRHRQGDAFLLITQDDHARLAGRFAERIGNDTFDPADPRESAVRGVALHDCGWPDHDDRPTLNHKTGTFGELTRQHDWTGHGATLQQIRSPTLRGEAAGPM